MTKSPKSCADTLTGNLYPHSTNNSPPSSAEDGVMTTAGKMPKEKQAAVPTAAPWLTPSQDRDLAVTSLTGQRTCQQQETAHLKLPSPAAHC